MPKDEFDLEDTGGGDPSLDDFFQSPDSGPSTGKGASPSIDDFFAPSPSEKAGAGLPVEKGKVPKAAPDAFAGADFASGLGEPVPPTMDEGGSFSAGRGFIKKNWLLIVIVLLVVLVGGSGGYLVYTMFLAPDQSKVAATKPQNQQKPKPAKPAANKPAPPATPDKNAAPPDKPADTVNKKDGDVKIETPKKDSDVKIETPKKDSGTDVKIPAPATDNKKPADATGSKSPDKNIEIAKIPAVQKPEPPPETKPSHQPVASTGGPYTIQVGSYMLEASKQEPEEKLRELGYGGDFRYVPEYRNLKIYHVLAGKNLSRPDAEKLAKDIGAMGYAPELLPGDQGYVVKVYSYGKYSVAKSTMQKLTKAGISDIKIQPETKEVTLDQLRVGKFDTKTTASKAQRDLKRNGFKEALIIQE